MTYQLIKKYIQMQQRLLGAQTGRIKEFAQAYVKMNFQADQIAGKHILNQSLKAVFNILQKLSYALFTLGVVLTIQSGGFDQQRFILFLQSSRSKSFLICLGIMGVTILTILREIKEDNKIQPLTRKGYNFVTDILRTILYILSIIFVEPFVFQDGNDYIIVASFWIFIVALLLFTARKITKWYYYLGQGKNILDPWVSKNMNDKDNVTKLTKLFDAYLNEKGLGGMIQTSENEIKGKIEELKELQEKLQDNLVQRENLMAQLKVATAPLK